MIGDQVRCACCGEVGDGDQAAGWRVWFPLDWDLPAELRPRPSGRSGVAAVGGLQPLRPGKKSRRREGRRAARRRG